jgi:predicted nuclease of predicted toxin-antitoxin system
VRLLLDMGVPRRTAALLREAAHDTVHLSERELCRLPDEDVLALAANEDRVVVTLDADFSALLALSGRGRPSVVHLRIEGLDFRRAARTIEQVLAATAGDLAQGCIASVTPGGTRVRRLPVVPPT